MIKSLAALAASVALFASAVTAQVAGTDPNPAMTTPDQQAWSLFLQVNARAGSAATFETWASDTDTFKPNPVFPGKPNGLKLRAPVVPQFGRALKAAKLKAATKPMNLSVQLAPGIDSGVSEETRRNKSAFDFIVTNKLYSVSGLKAAFGKTIDFPTDAIEVKANWVPVDQIPAFTLNRVAAGDVAKYFHISADAQGKQYALVSMHVISKLVPNWTWATFENRFNPGRCDILGCHDKFGSTVPNVAPNAQADKGYSDCPKTPALTAMINAAPVDAAFGNYCLKGSQTDFTDNSGLAIRLGNSITEDGFVPQSSCITCHSRAAWDVNGAETSQAGFDNQGNAPLGPMNPAWYWAFTAKPPIYQNMPGLKRIATGADFIWSIPFCAYDDTKPGPPPASPCAGK